MLVTHERLSFEEWFEPHTPLFSLSNSCPSQGVHHSNSCFFMWYTCCETCTDANSRLVRGQEVVGGTKPLSTCIRCWGWRPAGEKLASLQQASGKLHDEVWVGGVQSSSLRNSSEVEIGSGCAVTVSRLPSPFFAPESPGPGREIRSWIGWTPLEKTVRSGVWFFRDAFRGDGVFFCSLSLQLETG